MTGASRKKGRRPKHVPQRSCVICREKKDKRDLIRLVNEAEQGVIIDPSGKVSGRGAYICTRSGCWEKMSRTTVLDQALKTTIDAAHKAALQQQFKQSIKELSHV